MAAMSVPYFDLHNHTAFSYDAYGRPGDLFAEAARKGVAVVGITEHNNFGSLDEAKSAAKDSPSVKYVWGIELTVQTPWGSVDTLHYFPRTDGPAVAALLALHRARYEQMDHWRAEALQALGHAYEVEQLRRRYAATYPGRTDKGFGVSNQVMRAILLADGVIASLEDWPAMARRMAEAVPKMPVYPDVSASMAAMDEMSGVRVLAHAGQYVRLDDERADWLIDTLRLHGLEIDHQANSEADRAFLQAVASRRGLLVTGGSDCHEIVEEPETFGVYGGTAEQFEAFMAEARQVGPGAREF